MDLTNQFFIKNLNGFLKFLFIISIVEKVAASIEEESLSTSDKFNQTTFSNNQLLHYFHNFFNYIFGIFYIFTEENQFSTYVCAIFSSLLVGLTGIIPLLVIPLIKVTENLQGKNKALNRFLSFGLGSMLGDVFLHLLPESWSSEIKYHHYHMYNGIYVLIGLISFFVLEKCFLQDENVDIKYDNQSNANSNNNNNNNNTNQSSCNSLINLSSEEELSSIRPSGYLNLIANAVDNFTHGLAIGSSYLISTRVGILTTLAILCHEIPHEVGDFALLLRSGFSKMRAARLQIITASGSLIGAIFALNGGENANWILPFTSGGFIYIALSTVVPDLMQETSSKESFIHLTCMTSAIITMHLLSFLD